MTVQPPHIAPWQLALLGILDAASMDAADRAFVAACLAAENAPKAGETYAPYGLPATTSSNRHVVATCESLISAYDAAHPGG